MQDDNVKLDLPPRPNQRVADGAASEMTQQLAFLGMLSPDQRLCLPDWMVIAPPKTGTTWVSDNFRRHSQIFVPSYKEVKYFSNRFDTEDLRWYLAQFREGIGKSKGEAPPSYSLLPVSTIRLIRQLMPDLKLIYLMRDPVARGWSHARHCFRYGEANFKGRSGAIDDVSESDWIENLDDDWNRLCGDYLGQLERWLSVFPTDQVSLGFFDDIVSAPRQTLARLLEFLGVDAAFAESDEVTVEASNVGLSCNMPSRVEAHLIRMYAARTCELAEYLAREFKLPVPASWQRLLDAAQETAGRTGAVHHVKSLGIGAAPAAVHTDWQVDDARLTEVLSRDDLINMDFLSYRIISYRRRFMAYRASLGMLNAEDHSQDWWDAQIAAGHCLLAANIYDLKYAILRAVVATTMPPGSEAYRMHRFEMQLEEVERRHDDLAVICNELSQFIPSCLESIVEQLRSLQAGGDVVHQRLEGLKVEQSSTLQAATESPHALEPDAALDSPQIASAEPPANRLESLLADLGQKLSAWRNSRPFCLLQRVTSRIEKMTGFIPFPRIAKTGNESTPGSERDAA